MFVKAGQPVTRSVPGLSECPLECGEDEQRCCVPSHPDLSVSEVCGFMVEGLGFRDLWISFFEGFGSGLLNPRPEA